MKRLTTILISLIVAGHAIAQHKHIDSLWQKGNELYTSGMFKDATETYLSIVSSGNESADLYYNLGNAYFKQGLWGKAVLFYERALKLKPQGDDIIHNLELTQTKLADKITPVPSFFLTSFINRVKQSFSIDGWASMAVVLFIVGLGLILVAYFFTGRLSIRRTSFWTGVLLIALCVCCNFMARSLNRQHHAIVLAPVSTIKSSPDAIGKDIFILHEGTKVQVIDELSSWKKIKLSDGNQGWILAEDVEDI